MKETIAVVIVTYNRLGKLKKALASYDNQQRMPNHIIVVNNNSQDGTMEFLAEWESQSKEGVCHSVINLTENRGGAGGFRCGMQYALEHGADWIWIADDDAYLYDDTFTVLMQYIGSHDMTQVSCICGSVYTAGRIDIDHRRRACGHLVKLARKIPLKEYSKDEIKITETSYVGSCYKADALRLAGLPKEELFIYFDDTEHSHRVSKYGDIVLVPAIRILHDTGMASAFNPSALASWREYYLLRNHVFALKHYHTLTYFLYSFYKKMETYVIYLRTHRNKELLHMRLAAINDGQRAKLGIHPLYKPGYVINY